MKTKVPDDGLLSLRHKQMLGSSHRSMLKTEQRNCIPENEIYWRRDHKAVQMTMSGLLIREVPVAQNPLFGSLKSPLRLSQRSLLVSITLAIAQGKPCWEKNQNPMITSRRKRTTQADLETVRRRLLTKGGKKS